MARRKQTAQDKAFAEYLAEVEHIDGPVDPEQLDEVRALWEETQEEGEGPQGPDPEDERTYTGAEVAEGQAADEAAADADAVMNGTPRPTIDWPDGDDGSVGSIAETRANHVRAAGRRSRRGSGGLQPVIEQRGGKAPRKVEPKPCACGCGELTLGGDFRPGHDATLKSKLLQKARAGDADARAELIKRGWATEDGIDNPKAKGRLSDEQKVERAKAKLTAKVERLRFQLSEAEQALANA